jgi:hypothetical protein
MDVQQKLLLMISENEKLVDMVNESNLEIENLKEQYDTL